MRSLLLVLSMTVTLASYAQSITISDFRILASMEKQDSLNNYLSGKGYFGVNNILDLSTKPARTARAWKFTTGKKDDKAVSTILRYDDTSTYQVAFRTISPYIYTQIINSLIASGFNRVEAVASEQEVELIFSNGNENILIRSESRKNEPDYLLQYKRIPGRLIAYHPVSVKHYRMYAESRWRAEEDYVFPKRKTVARKKMAVSATRKIKSAPVKRSYNREAYE